MDWDTNVLALNGSRGQLTTLILPWSLMVKYCSVKNFSPVINPCYISSKLCLVDVTVPTFDDHLNNEFQWWFLVAYGKHWWIISYSNLYRIANSSTLAGNVSDVTFSNINISTRYYDPSWWGRAEPIYVTTCPRHSCSKEGSISNLQFINITAKSENGVFLSGSKGGLLSNLRFINMNLTYSRWTDYTGGLVDYRPGCQGLVNHSAAGIIMEHIEGFEIENVNMRWSDYQNELWDNPLDFRPSTVNNISLRNFHSALYKQMK